MKTVKTDEKEILHVVDEVKAILCNICGKSIDQNQFGYFDEHITVEKTWGYGSPFDSETHSFEICHKCYENMIKSFKIPVTIVN